MKFKKALFLLPIALMATSCSKTITKEEAIEFVKTNYTSRDTKTPQKCTVEWNFASYEGTNLEAAVKTSIALVTFDLDPDLKGSKVYAKEKLYPLSVLSSTEIKLHGDGVVYSLKGKELSYTVTTSNEENFNSSNTYSYNSDGYKFLEKNVQTATITLESGGTKTISGWLKKTNTF